MEPLPEAATASPLWRERFSRQLRLPQVGEAGQRKWNESTILLAGEGAALEAAGLGLATAGVPRLKVLAPDSFDPSPWTSRASNLKLENLSWPDAPLPGADFILVLTGDAPFRRRMNRELRARGTRALLGWLSAGGFALYVPRREGSAGACPCLECFEILNPKAFAEGDPEAGRILGALAASEALQYLSAGDSPLEGKVWMTSLAAGLSFSHEVLLSPKCPAALNEMGAKVTP